MSDSSTENRALTSEEFRLIRWLLEHGFPEAAQFLPQLERTQVTPYKCLCGCASLELAVDGQVGEGFLGILSEYYFGTEANLDLSGIFVFHKQGMLAGVEVYGLAGDAPHALPLPEELRWSPG